MKELSLNILDVAENSVKAKASLIEILLTEEENRLTIVISDDGCGMKREILEGVTNPFRSYCGQKYYIHFSRG